MRKSKTIFFAFALLLSGNVWGQQKQGLVGLLYDDIKLTRMSSLWYITALNSSETQWQTKHDFSARWIGYITAPVTGEITFYGEADNEMQLVINNKIVINTWGDADQSEGTVFLKKDRRYPIILLYRQINGSSYMRVYWSWKGHPKEFIPPSAISYDKYDEEQVMKKYKAQTRVDLSQLKFDIASIIQIHTPADVETKRKKVIHWLWGSAGFPSGKMPDKVTQGITDTSFTALKNLKRIDRMVINMDFGINSIVYHFIPKRANGSAAIYHQGHRGLFSLGFRTINAFLENGYDVYAFSMPLLGMNSKPVVDFPRFGKMIIHAHEQMEFLVPKEGHPIKYFLEPVAAVVNYMQPFHYKRLIMIGISGGGWTTTLYAAIDPRITISFPVAGSLPNYLRARDLGNSGSLGDYEQRVPELYRLANYLELYIMGSYGKGRSQLQILNEFDACCFRGTGFRTYKDIVKNRVRQLGTGSYDVFLDSTHRLHQISPKALEVIFDYLRKNQNDDN